MPLKLVRGSRQQPKPVGQQKCREEYLVHCLREEKGDAKFTDWERRFISSLARQIDQGRRLTEKQKEVLERIWEK